jgi:hypothetical protein
VVLPIYISAISIWECLLLHIFVKNTCWLFLFQLFEWDVVVSHCGYNLNFLGGKKCWRCFHVLMLVHKLNPSDVTWNHLQGFKNRLGKLAHCDMIQKGFFLKPIYNIFWFVCTFIYWWYWDLYSALHHVVRCSTIWDKPTPFWRFSHFAQVDIDCNPPIISFPSPNPACEMRVSKTILPGLVWSSNSPDLSLLCRWDDRRVTPS